MKFMSEKEGQHLIGEMEGYGICPRRRAPVHTIIDVGANVGIFALKARLEYPAARIIALEPTPETFEVLQDNMQGLNVEIYRLALGDGSRCKMRGRSSVQKHTVPSATGGTQTLTFADIMKKFDVQADRTCAAKFDCEGGEYSLLTNPEDKKYITKLGVLALEIHGRPAGQFKFLDGWMRLFFRDYRHTLLRHSLSHLTTESPEFWRTP